jgi:hypothetical protein
VDEEESFQSTHADQRGPIATVTPTCLYRVGHTDGRANYHEDQSISWPPPTQEHAEPEPFEAQTCVEKLVVSHIISIP